MSEAPTQEAETYFAPRKHIYQQSVRGKFRSIKWMLLIATLAVYYFLPFVRWDRGPNAPDQAVLVDLAGRRFYFFFIELWPQEVYYLTGLLILASLILFLMNAVAGRIWCGYLCPQTVWTDLFFAVERFFEGDRREHMRTDAGGLKKLTPAIAARKAGKHFTWLMIAWWTGGAWVLYFADAPTLVWNLATFQAPAIAYIWIGILTLTTYLFAGWMREQVCIFLCPWPRIQAALTDEEALNVTYRHDRGEPRMSVKAAEAARARSESAGDCVDCLQCVAVCPTGVDIRDGFQLGCIQCGLCIDACDNVMAKIGRPSGLIGYDTDNAIEARRRGEAPEYRMIRPRTILYMVAIVLVAGVMLFALLGRSDLGLSAQHDRNPMFVTLSDGSIRNAYTLRIANKALEQRTFRIEFFGPAGASINAAGAFQELGGRSILVAVGPNRTHEVRAFVTAARSAITDSHAAAAFRLTDVDSARSVTVRDSFVGP